MNHALLSFILVTATACGTISDHAGSSPDAGGGGGGVADAGSGAPTGAGGSTAIGANAIAAFSATDQTPTSIPFTAVAYDDGKELDSQGGFTATAAGDYEICAVLAGPASLAMILEIFVDNVRYGGLGSGTTVAHGCMSARVAASQRVDVRVTQSSGSTQLFTSDPAASWLTIHHEVTLVEVTASTPFTLPDATFVAIPYDTVLHDDRHEFNATTSEFVASVPGDYRFCAAVAGPQGLGYEIDLFKNEARERAFVSSNGKGSGCRTLRLAANDAVTIDMYQQQPTPVASAAVPANPAWTRVTIAQLATESQLGNNMPFMLATGTLVQIPYIAPLVDDNHAYDLTTHRYTVASGGDYEICGSLAMFNPTPILELALFVNGAQEKTLALNIAAGSGCRTVRASAGEALQLDALSTIPSQEGPSLDWDWMTVRRLP